MNATLYYVHDPLCSWCWAFQPVWKEIQAELPADLTVKLVLGGLAPDSDDPMPQEMQQFLQQTWHKIQSVVPGTEFNFDFWTVCKPRRSTYPACRAVIATKNQKPELEQQMIAAIQQAYYLDAKNPSDADTLISLADNLGLDNQLFARDLNSEQTRETLHREIRFHLNLGAKVFPGLIVESNNQRYLIPSNYIDAFSSINSITALL